jgi:TolA-binding protein
MHTGRTHVFFPSLILIFIFMLTGCASTDDLGKVQYGLKETGEEVKEIKEISRRIEQEVPKSLRQMNEKIEGTKDSQEATARAVSNLFIKVQDLSNEIQQTTGQIDEYKHLSDQNLNEGTEKRGLLAAEMNSLELMLEDLKASLQGMKAELQETKTGMQDMKTELQADIQGMKTGMDEMRADQEFQAKKLIRMETRRIPPKKNISKKAANQAAGTAKGSAKVDVKDLFNSAAELYKAGKFTEARAKFRSVIDDYDENDLSGDARLLIGDCSFMEKKYEDAALAYEELLEENPDSDKISRAKLMQGLAFYELEDTVTGEFILKSLIERFPDSKDAALARKKLGIPAVTVEEGE